MSETPEQIEIDVSDLEKKPESAEIEVVKAEQEPAKRPVREIEPEEGLQSLRDQLEKERAARIQADKRAQQAMETASHAKNEVQDSNLHLVTNAIETVKQSTEMLKNHYREAMSVNDYDRAAEIQQAMATNAAKMLQLEQGKQALESQPKIVPQQYQPADPVEALAAQLTPRSAQWLRSHPQFATDQRLYQKMVSAHNIAMADGHAADSDGYFDAVEDILKINRNVEQDDDAMATAAKPTQRRSSPPAAPVTRSGNGTGSRANTVRLSAEEREIAAMNKMTDQEYAIQKLKIEKGRR
jgi:prepilin-type processing-associated H-X9-DG protein